MPDLRETMLAIVGTDGVVSGAELRQRASSYWDPSPLRAALLVRPRSTAEVSEVMRRCHQLGQAVVTHGGLSGCVEGTTVTPDEIVVSLERMNAIEEIDPIGRTATVQAGAVLQLVQEAVAEKDLYFPLDLGARGSCTIGGNVATNAGGVNVIRYGMMREQVLGLEAVLADGTIISSLNRMLKNNAGYDVKQLFIGTEGTLGIVTRVIIKLRERPLSQNCALVGLTTFSAVVRLLKALEKALGGMLSAYEVMWGDYLHAVTEPGWHRSPMGRDHPFYVLLEADGASIESDAERFMAAMEEALETGLIEDAVIPKSAAERDALWDIRENFEAIMQAQPTFLYDVSLPIKDMEAYIAEVRVGLQQRWPEHRCYVIGHIGDGNLHLFVSPGVGDQSLHGDSDIEVYTPLKQYAGSISAEHGVGVEKRGWLQHSRSPAEIALMRQLKQTLDPDNLLNPGKVLEP